MTTPSSERHLIHLYFSQARTSLATLTNQRCIFRDKTVFIKLKGKPTRQTIKRNKIKKWNQIKTSNRLHNKKKTSIEEAENVDLQEIWECILNLIMLFCKCEPKVKYKWKAARWGKVGRCQQQKPRGKMKMWQRKI